MDEYFLSYASLDQQRWMVADHPRTHAFARAIAEVVKPGDVVIDVGAGTGILSMLAAKAGARRVIAVEQSAIASLARELISHNGLDDVIEVFEGDGHELVLDEKADVIVSEWLGHMAYVENMFAVVRSIRDAWLKPDGVMLPSSTVLHLAAVDAGELYTDHGPGFWEKGPIEGLDFSFLTERELDRGYARKLQVPNEYLIGPGTPFHHLDTKSARKGDEWSVGRISLPIERDAMLNGFVGWFSCGLSPGVVLDTGPHMQTTHWEQTLFPFHPMAVRAGQTVDVEYRYDDTFDIVRMVEITFRVGDQRIRYLVD